MKPAFSVIFLTTLIGAGQGLFLALFCALLLARFGLLPEQSNTFHALGGVLVLLLSGLGLLASFFHLGRPERAWRSAAMWRTSWLSREVIVLPAFMGMVLCYAAVFWADWQVALFNLPYALVLDLPLLLGALAAILALLLYLCTGMIYACLPFLREWHSPLTVANYLLLGSASGCTLAAAYAATAAPPLARFYVLSALALTLLAWLGRWASLWRNRRLRPKATLQTAIGIKHPRIVQKSAGFLGGSFNTREFFHGQTPRVLRAIKWFFIIFTFPLPMLLLQLGMEPAASALLVWAFAVQYLGLLAERWFFFAQANHPQNLYYQAIH